MIERLRSRRALWTLLLIVAAALVAAAVAGRPGSRGLPLDPMSAAGDGTKALVDSLRALGVDVRVQPGPPGADTPAASTAAVLMIDALSDADRQRLDAWVRSGGTLVLADSSSPLAPIAPRASAGLGVLHPQLPRRCDLPALRDVEAVKVRDAVLFRAQPGTTGCFIEGRDAFLVDVPQGAGHLVLLGSAGVLDNAELGDADNALLAVSLLAPTGTSTAVILTPPKPGGGRRGLQGLISRRVKLTVLQLGIAFGVLALWRGRRLGRPVAEPQPVPIPASELVSAVGHLFQRAQARSQAAAILRDDLRRLLAERLGLPPTAGPDVVAEVGAARAGVDVQELRAMLSPTDPPDEAAFVALAQSLESVRREVGVAP